MAWTDPRTWNVGETVTKAIMDAHIRDQFRVLQGGTARQVLRMNSGATAPEYVSAAFARVTRSTNQTIATATSTPISFDTEVSDTAALWSAGAPTVFTIPYAGVWLCGGNVDFNPNATGYRWLQLLKNSTSIIFASTSPGASTDEGMSVTTAAVFAASDTLSLEVRQTSGGNLNIGAGTGNPNMWALFIGP